jgi:carbon-monoxide dehydrogenase medium subunit
MFPANFRYHSVKSFDEAIAALKALGPESKLMAGGQTLIPMMKLRLLKPTDVIDIGRIETGKDVAISADTIEIGSLMTHHAIGKSEAGRTSPIISDCGLGIADAQIRSMGTIGGSLAEADPCSCWPTLLVALNARVRCQGPNGVRIQSVRELLQYAYTPELEEAELVTSVLIDRAALEGFGAFVAFKRAAPAYPTASCALQYQVDDGAISRAHLALGCVGLTPLAVDGAAALLEKKQLTAKLIDEVAALAAETSEPLADNKGSEAYKRSLIRGLVTRAFAIAEMRRQGHPTPHTHTYYG